MKNALLMTLLAATLSAAEVTSKPKDENPQAALAQQLQGAGVKSIALEASTFTAEVSVTGQVLDPVPLLSAYQDWISANLTATTSVQEWERLKKLQPTGEVSAKLLQSTEAEAKKAQAAAFVALQKLQLALGSEVLQQGRLEALLKGIAQGELALVRLDLPLGVMVENHPTASVTSIFNPEKPQTATWLGQAPVVSPLTQGPALLYTLEKPQASLRAGATVQGTLSLKESSAAWFVPESALVRASGKTFVYRETGEVSPHHVRCSVKLLQRTTRRGVEGWLVNGSLKAGDKIVSQGAFTLLAWETLENEDGGEVVEEIEKSEAKTTPPEKNK
jgi:hypothetical protein